MTVDGDTPAAADQEQLASLRAQLAEAVAQNSKLTLELQSVKRASEEKDAIIDKISKEAAGVGAAAKKKKEEHKDMMKEKDEIISGLRVEKAIMETRLKEWGEQLADFKVQVKEKDKLIAEHFRSKVSSPSQQ